MDGRMLKKAKKDNRISSDISTSFPWRVISQLNSRVLYLGDSKYSSVTFINAIADIKFDKLLWLRSNEAIPQCSEKTQCRI